MKKSVLFLSFIFVAGCAAQVDGGLGDRPTFTYGIEGVMLPFPSDRYLAEADASRPLTQEYGTDYRIRVEDYLERDPVFQNYSHLAESLETLDGFGTSADIVVELTAEAAVPELLDETMAYERSVAADSPIVLLSIDADDPKVGTPLPFSMRQISDGKTLLVRPWLPLRPSGWYALVFKPNFTDAVGRRYTAPPGFRERFDRPDPTTVEGQGYKRLREVYSGRSVFALTFRTASIHTKMLDLAADVRMTPPLPITYSTRTPPPNLPHVSTIVDGWFTQQNYRNAKGKLEPSPVGKVKVPFTLTLPKVSATVQEPFGVLLVQHGFGAQRQGALHQADAHAEVGMATLALDGINHGERGAGDEQASGDFLQGLRHTFGIWTENGEISIKAWMMRDIIRQQALDYLQLVLALKAWEGDVPRPDNQPGPDLDFDLLALTGQSMGGVMSGVIGAVMPEIDHVLLNVAGGRISEVFAGNEIVKDYAVKLMTAAGLAESHGWRMIAMVQTALDPGDPINYVGRISGEAFNGRAPRPLLLQGVDKDTLVPNKATFDLARAAGATYVGPFFRPVPDLPIGSIPAEGLEGDAVPLLSYFDRLLFGNTVVPADHGNMWASPTALSQAVPFLKTGRIVEPLAP